MILIKWFGTLSFTGDNAGKKRELSDDEHAPQDLTPLRNKVNVFLLLSFFLSYFVFQLSLIFVCLFCFVCILLDPREVFKEEKTRLW